MKSTIQSLDFSFLLHATEDYDRVCGAVRRLMGDGAPLETEEMEGHFGNRILKVSAHLHGQEATRSFESLAAAMPEALKSELVADIDRSIDEHSSLYIRFDKQKLVQGDVAFGADDVVRVKVKPRAYLMRGRAKEFFVGQLGPR